MKLRHLRCFSTVGLLLLLRLSLPGISQTARPPVAYPAHLPYSFSNFVWWSDDELRALLKKRIPGLGDEIATTSEAKGRIRNALTLLLKEKGIVAEVQSQAPSNSAFGPPMTELLGMGDLEVPPYTPSIIFSVLGPKVVVGRVTLQLDAEDVRSEIEPELNGAEGKPFTSESMSFSRRRIEELLMKSGYLRGTVQLRRMPPYKQGDTYSVDWTVDITAGSKFHISSVTVDGGPLFADKDLTQFASGHVGEIAGISPFRQLGPELRAAYQESGFADVRITAEPKVDNEHATVSYSLKVIPGPVYRLRSLTIEKLAPEQEQRVRGLLGMQPGEVFRESAINNLYRKIANEPSLKGYSFGFRPRADKAAAVVDLSLTFFKEGGESSVTIK